MHEHGRTWVVELAEVMRHTSKLFSCISDGARESHSSQSEMMHIDLWKMWTCFWICQWNTSSQLRKKKHQPAEFIVSCSSGVLLARHFPLDIKRASPVGEENNSRESQLGEELLRELCNANKVNQGMHVTELVLKSGEKLPLIFYVIGLSFLRHVMQVPYCVNDKLCM